MLRKKILRLTVVWGPKKGTVNPLSPDFRDLGAALADDAPDQLVRHRHLVRLVRRGGRSTDGRCGRRLGRRGQQGKRGGGVHDAGRRCMAEWLHRAAQTHRDAANFVVLKKKKKFKSIYVHAKLETLAYNWLLKTNKNWSCT